MGNLLSLSQNVMDLYYQQYKKDDDFFELYHFKYLCSVAYASLLQDEFEKSYKRNMIEYGIGFVFADLNQDWFIAQEIDITRASGTDTTDIPFAPYEATLKCAAFSFGFDRHFSGIKDIIPSNGRCTDFIRMSVEESWKFKLLPSSSDVYWFPLKKKIHFSNIKCGLSRATIIYIPGLDGLNDGAVVAGSLEQGIIERTLNLMLQARNGQPIIDTTIDGNPNKILETEINNHFQKAKR